MKKDEFEDQELNAKAENQRKYENIVAVVEEHEKYLKMKENILRITSRHGYILQNFKESNKYKDMIKQFGQMVDCSFKN